jgi:hypothetical protein
MAILSSDSVVSGEIKAVTLVTKTVQQTRIIKGAQGQFGARTKRRKLSGKRYRLTQIDGGRTCVQTIALTIGISSCAAVEAARSAQEEKQKIFEHRVDTAHIWVTTEAAPSGKPYATLGDLSYTEMFSADAIDGAKISDKLKKIALDKWPDMIDAIVNENQTVSADGSQITVTRKAIQYESSADRAALHHLNEGLVASPNGN